MNAIELLRVSKESIINVYTKRCPLSRMSISDMMDKATWMDAQAALMNGFIDNIADSAVGGPVDCVLTRDDAERKVRAWRERHLTRPPVRSVLKESAVVGAVAEDNVVVNATVEDATVQGSDAVESTGEPEAQSVPDVQLTEQRDDDIEVSPSEVAPDENAPADSTDSGELSSEELTAPTEYTEATEAAEAKAPTESAESTTLTEPTEPTEPCIHVSAIEKRLLHLKTQLTDHI